MSLLLSKLKEELDKQTLEITQTITETVLLRVDEKIKPILQENTQLRSEVEKLNTKIKSLEVNAKKNNLLLHGIPETNEENTQQLLESVTSTIKSLDVELNNCEVGKVYRLGKTQGENKIRPIVFSITSLHKKILILENKNKMMKGSYITQDYTKEEQERRKQFKKRKENEKRKRSPSKTPSPSTSDKSNSDDSPTNIVKPDPKVPKVDAFACMRAGAYAMSSNKQ